MRICTDCKQSKPESEFGMFRRNDNGKLRYRAYCKKCHHIRQGHSGQRQRNHERRAERIKENVHQGSILHIARQILQSSKKNDRWRGLTCDLDLEFVIAHIQSPCIYCGEADYRRSLDRVDNTLGHLKNNVVTACVRCNLTRANMPYEAWLVVANAMREARERGLFGDWKGIKTCGRRVKKHRGPASDDSAEIYGHGLIMF